MSPEQDPNTQIEGEGDFDPKRRDAQSAKEFAQAGDVDDADRKAEDEVEEKEVVDEDRQSHGGA